mmetsp:Transcript_96406/g.274808  ORF Transcript_96406/g.274808 Transcript_96406/m.274808 type:complete len:103 (-) Transcript_96406:1562-1870(-)
MAPASPAERGGVFQMMLMLMLSGPANFVLYRLLFAEYGEKDAFFVSQGVNFLYCVYGGILLYPKVATTDGIATTLHQPPPTTRTRPQTPPPRATTPRHHHHR